MAPGALKPLPISSVEGDAHGVMSSPATSLTPAAAAAGLRGPCPSSRNPPSGHPDAVLIYGGQLSFARTYQGRAEEIIEMLEQSVSAYPAIPAFRAGFAGVLCWLDRRREAAAILEQAASDGFEHVARERTRRPTRRHPRAREKALWETQPSRPGRPRVEQSARSPPERT